MLARLPQDKALADIMRDVKANSSRWVHASQRAMSGFAWQRGYGAFSVSASQAQRVWQYISEQEKHHRSSTFDEEFVKLLTAHGVAFDERFLWR